MAARKLADDVARFLVPRKRETSFREFFGSAQVEK